MNIEGWPWDKRDPHFQADFENAESGGHSDLIVAIDETTLSNGKVSKDTKVLLLLLGLDAQGNDRWITIEQLMKVDLDAVRWNKCHDWNHGHQYVIRSPDFTAFNALFSQGA